MSSSQIKCTVMVSEADYVRAMRAIQPFASSIETDFGVAKGLKLGQHPGTLRNGPAPIAGTNGRARATSGRTGREIVREALVAHHPAAVNVSQIEDIYEREGLKRQSVTPMLSALANDKEAERVGHGLWRSIKKATRRKAK